MQFSPEEKHNYIQNVETGQKIQMERKGRSYVLDAEFVVEEDKMIPIFPRHAVTRK